MKIVCIHHALLREKTGRDSDVLELPVTAKVQDVLAQLKTLYPQLDRTWPTLKFAVNDEFAQPQTALRDGDRIDLLPPFGGG